jgi:hypothetical protein
MFCGRFLCSEKRETKPLVQAAYDEDGDDPKFIIVEDASWCGECNPMPIPIDLPESE